MKFLPLVFKNLWRSKLRSSLTAMAVVFLVAVFSMVATVLNFLDKVMTERTKDIVMDTVAKSRLFSSVSPTPVSEGGVLTIVIDNVPLTGNAVGKGIGTGLTFGLVGNMVTDGYVCTATYAAGGKSTSATVKHALHTTIGNKEGPPGLTPMKPGDAIPVMIRQMTLNALKGLGGSNL